MSREKALIKNIFILSIGTILPKMAQFILLPIYTAVLTKEEYGTYDLINILVSVFIPIVTLQIQQAAFRFLIDVKNKKEKEKIISNMYIFIVPISLISVIALFIFLNHISLQIKILISIYFFIDILAMVTLQVVRGLGQNKQYSVSSIIGSAINVVLVIIFMVVFKSGLKGLLIVMSISRLIALNYLFYKINIIKMIKISDFDKEFINRMIKYSWPMIPNTVSLWVVNLSDRLIISGILGLQANAIYAVANKIPSLVGLIYGNFSMAWQESASIASKDKDINKYYSDIFDNLFNFLIGIVALLIGGTPILFSILIKGDYLEAYYQMPILFIGIFFSCISSYYGGIFVGLKETKKVGISSLIGAVINIVINLMFIKKIGVYAASLSTVISYFIIVIYRLFSIKKMIDINYKWTKNIISILVLIIMCILCYKRNLMLNIINIIIGMIITISLNKVIIRSIVFGIKNKNIIRVKKFN